MQDLDTLTNMGVVAIVGLIFYAIIDAVVEDLAPTDGWAAVVVPYLPELLILFVVVWYFKRLRGGM